MTALPLNAGLLGQGAEVHIVILVILHKALLAQQRKAGVDGGITASRAHTTREKKSERK